MARGAIPVDTSFPDMLLWAAAVFAIKITLMHALQVRSRLMTGDNTSSRQAHWVEDESIPDVFLKAFQVMFVTFAGPVLDINRLGGAQQNAAENELFFLALGSLLSAHGSVPANGADIVKYYVYSRLVHAATFVFKAPQPARALAWASGMACMMVLAAAALGY
tara:strand:- start:104 stop:592 length:489 start_codon:yes stop_codon:yes gene_type:complete